MNEQNKIWIDPPSGWKYGYPKLVENSMTVIIESLKKSGYTDKDIEFAYNNCRFWYEKEEEPTEEN